ncbi:MAG: hypothetical protein JW748_00805 [Anaerolineales bacterium]|nr:hypothetical protein [Anaerolineales bacterium]
MHIVRKIAAPFFLAWLVSSCSGNPSAVEPVPPTPSVFVQSGLLSSSTKESMQTPMPEAGLAPSEAAAATTAAPTGLNPAGPYAVFEGREGIWIANPDGSFPTRIAEQGIGTESLALRDSIASRGDRIALIVRDETGLNLVTVEIPSGRMKTVARLIDVTRRELSLNSMTAKAFAYYAVTEFPNLAWQPGSGGVLAYTGLRDGASADLFTFDFDWEKTRHVEQDPSQAIRPIWSPDGSHLLFFGVDWLPPFGATYITFQPMAGFWAVQASDNRILAQPKLKGTHQNFIGWQDNTHYLVYDSGEKCPAKNLRSVDLVSGEAAPIAEFCLSSRPAFSPVHGALLISVGADCGCELAEGVYLTILPSMAPVRLLEKAALDLSWLPESRLFYAYPEALFSADGNVRYDPPVMGASYRPAVSRSGAQAWVVMENHRSRVMLRTPGSGWRTILEGGVSAMLWDPVSGETLLIVTEGGALYAAAVPDFTPRRIGDLGGYFDRAAWTPAPG